MTDRVQDKNGKNYMLDVIKRPGDTEGDFARKSRVSPVTLGSYTRGHVKRMTKRVAEKLSVYSGTPVTDIIEGYAVWSKGVEHKKSAGIPKERFLGVYFKKKDTDLIEWKKAADEAGENMGDFAREALREKLQRDTREAHMEHPSTFLKRMEVQQIELVAMIQQMSRELKQGVILTGGAKKPESEEMIMDTPVDNQIDKKCTDAGWE